MSFESLSSTTPPESSPTPATVISLSSEPSPSTTPPPESFAPPPAEKTSSIALIASNEECVSVEEDIAARIPLIREKLQEIPGDLDLRLVSLPEVSSATLTKILEYCASHRAELSEAIKGKGKSTSNGPTYDEELMDWDREFFAVGDQMLQEMHDAAKHLGLENLANLAQKWLVETIRARISESILTLQKLTGNSTMEEQAAFSPQLLHNQGPSTSGNAATKGGGAAHQTETTDSEDLISRFRTTGQFTTPEQAIQISSLIYAPHKSASMGPHSYVASDIGIRSYAEWTHRFTIANTIKQLSCLVDFLEKRGPNVTWNDLEEAFRNELRNPADNWPPDKQKQLRCIWELLCLVLHFDPLRTEFRAASTLKDIKEKFFLEKNIAIDFKYTLEDLENLGLTVEPTDTLYEHLQLDEKKMKIRVFAVQSGHLWSLLASYDKNKVAKVLGLESLGGEVLRTIKVLLGTNGILIPKAQSLGLVDSGSKEAQCCMPAPVPVILSRCRVEEYPIKLLATNIAKLDNICRTRKRWYNILLRDMKERMAKEPLLFYGALLAIFFGVCTVIQTIASIWSLALAIRQASG